eukprot:901146-Rhodomonas_salina.1
MHLIPPSADRPSPAAATPRTVKISKSPVKTPVKTPVKSPTKVPPYAMPGTDAAYVLRCFCRTDTAYRATHLPYSVQY